MHTNPTHRRTKAKEHEATESSPNQVEESRNPENTKLLIERVLAGLGVTDMKINKRGGLRLHSSNKLVRWTCILGPSIIIFCLIRIRSQRRYTLTTNRERCWLQNAFLQGDFMVGSHRSLGDSEIKNQPTCLEGLKQLNINGIHYLDLDVIFDPVTAQLLVAHPLEFQGATDIYSPCAKKRLQKLLQLIDTVMPPQWLVSLELKADWDRTREFPFLKEPLLMLQEMLAVAKDFNLKPEHCTLYVDANKVEPTEEPLLDQLAQYCSFSFAVRRHEAHDAHVAIPKRHYDYLMATIEFHPSHPNYQATTGVASLQVAQETVFKSVYWVVDTPQDLERVALFQGAGLVSNRPLEIVKMLQDPHYGWCVGKEK